MENQVSAVNLITAELKDIRSKLKKYIDKLPEEIKKLSYKSIIKIIEDNFKSKTKDDFIRQIILYSDEFHEIKRINDKYLIDAKESFKFHLDEKIWDVSADGTEVNLDNNLSEGEATTKIIEAVIETLIKKKESKKIIIDDSLSNLDMKNLRKISKYLIGLKDNVEILTHDNNIYDHFLEIANDENKNINKFKIAINENAEDIIPTKIKNSMTANELISRITDSNPSLETNNINILFPRLFLRYNNKYGTLSDNRLSRISCTQGISMFRWSSNNIMHYEESINYKIANKYLEKYGIDVPKKCDSISLIKCIINKISKGNNCIKYGMSKRRIISFLERAIFFLEIEKQLLEKNLFPSVGVGEDYKTKNERLNAIWDNDITGRDKSERNDFMHSIEEDISIIMKSDD